MLPLLATQSVDQGRHNVSLRVWWFIICMSARVRELKERTYSHLNGITALFNSSSTVASLRYKHLCVEPCEGRE